ncbi:uncharacterized protein LOC132194065 [Neocloeon triangulifer]|uniref:uncharacterized protein LOC132194065 n=1 Tax=Neocloeon triangulifer TaxID=2078957 RepID=UPI00286F91A2|nr:uncharacterized protein LOC132194065 [Neocloeon triangulifer]
MEAAEEACGKTLGLTLTNSGNPSFGFTLSRSKVEPYPKVDYVESESAADKGGLNQGDVVFEINGRGLLGCSLDCVLKIIATSVHKLELTLWRPKDYHPDLDLAKTLIKVAQLLSCPICLREVALQPRQCRNGHLMCAKCAVRSPKGCCPLCRVFLGRPANNRLALPGARCLLAEKMVAVMRTDGEELKSKAVDESNNTNAERENSLNRNASMCKKALATAEENSSKSSTGKLHMVARIVRALR